MIRFSIVLISSIVLIGIQGCSLDGYYFDPTQTDSYQMSSDHVPAAQVTEHSFSSNSNTIYALYLQAQTQTATTKTIFYVHGNDKNINKYWTRLDYLYQLNPGVNVFVFDFQGFGKSTGSPSLAAVVQNTKDAFAYMLNLPGVNRTKIVDYAYSEGSIFALPVATQSFRPAALILESAPASSSGYVRSTTRIGCSSKFVFNETFDNMDPISKVFAPILILHGGHDETIPFRDNALLLNEAASNPKQLVEVGNAGHSDLIETLGGAQYLNVLETFFAQYGI